MISENNIHEPQINRSYYIGIANSYYQQMVIQIIEISDIKSSLISSSYHTSSSIKVNESYDSLSSAEIMSCLSDIQSLIESNMNKLRIYMSSL